MRELLLGAGNRRTKHLHHKDRPGFVNVTTLDIDPRCNPDVVWDLNDRPLPFDDAAFDEIHAYEVLEHIGRQGDWRGFFAEFTEYHRILKPGGMLVMTVPRYDSEWAWGDPGHTRVITAGTLYFLAQDNYTEVGSSAMTDYRDHWHGNLVLVHDAPFTTHSRLFALLKA